MKFQHSWCEIQYVSVCFGKGVAATKNGLFGINAILASWFSSGKAAEVTPPKGLLVIVLSSEDGFRNAWEAIDISPASVIVHLQLLRPFQPLDHSKLVI